MATPDLSQGFDTAKSKINSYSSYIGISQAAKKLEKEAGNSESESTANLTSSLDKISTQQKRYLRNPPNSFDQLLDLINLTNGSGLDSTKYLRKKLLEASVKIEPKIQEIISTQALKALGCSQEQTFTGFTSVNLSSLGGLNGIDPSLGIYVPVQAIDIAGILKESPESKVGKILYEKPQPSVDTGVFRPYQGEKPFPMNKTLNLRMDNNNKGVSYYEEYGKYYQGVSGKDLFDIQYSPTNGYGNTQDCYKVALISGVSASDNKVGTFLKDYYSTIKLVDSADIGASIVNLISGAISIKSQLGADELSKKTEFALFVERILGMCFDSRREIDVSGISKIAELDGVDESFFELTEVDLRNIDLKITNIQNGVMEFEDCDNVKLPVDYDTLIDDLIVFRDSLSGQTTQDQVASLEGILDTIYQNPDWKLFIPTNFNLDVAVNKDILKQIPIAIASTVLSPKVLLPIFILLQVVENGAVSTYNKEITPGNAIIQSGNTNIGQVNNIVNNQIDFLKVFKTFNIQVISKIGGIFIETLFEILKKDLIILLGVIVKDITTSKLAKRYRSIKILLEIAALVVGIAAVFDLVDDYRKCKSLVDKINQILSLIYTTSSPTPPIPLPLLLLTKFLPGTSPERSTINTIQELQSLGIPTGTLPDGSPNLMLLYNLSTHKGADKEESEHGGGDGVAITPEGIPIPVLTKQR